MIINEHTIPNNINIGLITPLLKDRHDSHFDIKNNQPIMISDSISIYEKYILEEINTKIADTIHQYGFKPFSSFNHANFINHCPL